MTDESGREMRVPFEGALVQQVWDLADLALKSRFVEAINAGVSRYPIYRDLRFAARIDLDELFDALALNPQWTAQRLDSRTMILDADDALISARGGRKSEYCSCYFSIWASSVSAAQAKREAILARVGDALVTDPMFSIDWHFLTSKGELESASIEELADDELHDAAYPDLAEGVHDFVARYLDSSETVLVLQGPPGTGKTRLIRAILGEMSRTKGRSASALYTGDKRALENDEIFVRFITGWEDAFVVEDADHLLRPRAEGNENLHRFLAIADGVVRAQGRKIIFSTNLPNVHDLDDALVRPGRCFARLMVRELTLDEAIALIERLVPEDLAARERSLALLGESTRSSYSLAEVYKATGLAS